MEVGCETLLGIGRQHLNSCAGIKKNSLTKPVNQKLLSQLAPQQVEVIIEKVEAEPKCEESELDEM